MVVEGGVERIAVNRRKFLRTVGKTGVGLGAFVWATPLVQTTVPAWAAAGSGAPVPGVPGTGGGAGAVVPGGVGTAAVDNDTVLAAEDVRVKDGSNGGGLLAFTGSDPWNLVKLAGGAIAVGGAARAVARKLDQQDETTDIGYLGDGGIVER